MQESKEDSILEAYAACKENALLAAALLGIGKTTLYRVLLRLRKAEKRQLRSAGLA